MNRLRVIQEIVLVALVALACAGTLALTVAVPLAMALANALA